MAEYVNPKLILNQLSKVRKSTNFHYKQAIDRNKKKLVRHPPLINLLSYLRSRNYTEKEIDGVVAEYWNRLEKNPNMEKEIAKKFKMLYSNKA